MNPVTVVFGSDHAGFELKNRLLRALADEGYKTVDAGTYSAASCDYPVYAEAACRLLLAGEADLGILVCGTGIGMSLAANKIPGIRAACCSDAYSAKYTRLHNDANVLCIGARVVGEGLALQLAHEFLETPFDTEHPNHRRRIGEIAALEAGETLQTHPGT